MSRKEKAVEELRTLAGKLETFTKAVVADNESTSAYIDSLRDVVSALGARQEAQGELVQALRNRLDSSDKVFRAFEEVARVSVQLAEGLESSKERAEAIERATEQLAKAQERIDARAAGDAKRLLEEVAGLKRTVEILASLASES